MPGIFTALSSTAYSLQSQSFVVQQTGKNIANINNEGYSRQRVQMGTTGAVQTAAGPTSGPLVATGIEHIRDVFLDRQILGEISYLSGLEASDFRLKQALGNLGDNIDRAGDAQFVDDIVQSGGGLRGAIDYFFNTWESLAARPNDATTRQVMIQASDNLVEMFHRVDDRFDLLESELTRQIDEEVDILNDLFLELEEMNLEIARLETGDPGSALDMRDLRQQKLEEISEYMLIEAEEVKGANGQIELTVARPDGTREVLMGPGVTAKQIYFDSDNSSFHIDGSNQEIDLRAGLIPAVLAAKDETVQPLRENIDLVAHNLAVEVNQLYYQAFVPAGADPAVPEMSFFQVPTPPGGPGTVTAATISLYSEPSDPSVTSFLALTAENLRTSNQPGISGANDLALDIAELAEIDQAALGSVSFSEFSSNLVTELGQDIRNVGNRMQVQEDVKELLETRRREISGVSMDEEVSNMLQYQKAYQATSRFFNVLNEMLDTLINGLGR